MIRERIDKVMSLLMEKLSIEQTEWKRTYKLRLTVTKNRNSILFSVVDQFGARHDILESMTVTGVEKFAQ